MAQHKDKHARVWKWRKGQPAGQSASEPIGVCGAATSTLLLLPLSRLLHIHYTVTDTTAVGAAATAAAEGLLLLFVIATTAVIAAAR